MGRPILQIETILNMYFRVLKRHKNNLNNKILRHIMDGKLNYLSWSSMPESPFLMPEFDHTPEFFKDEIQVLAQWWVSFMGQCNLEVG